MKIPRAIVVLGGLAVVAGGCHEHAPAEVGTTDTTYPPSSEVDDDSDTEDLAEVEPVPAPVPAPVITAPAPSVYAETRYDAPAYRRVLSDSGWERIGDREVEDRSEKGKLRVGRGERHMSELVLLVEGAPVDIYDITVMFGDGTSYSPTIGQRFNAGSRSPVIQLPAYHAPVTSILFRYGTPNRGDEAKVEVWGR